MKDIFSANYSEVYDDLYSAKDYKTEADFISAILKRYNPRIFNILDLGCGTGVHDFYLNKLGYMISGVDQSLGMLDAARKKNPSGKYIQSSIADLDLGEKFDAVISLFHVFSYQVEDAAVRAFFQTMRRHMHEHSVGIVDFWYGPAVLKTEPQTTRKVFKHKQNEVIRLATPARVIGKPAYKMNIRMDITGDGIGCKSYEEDHVMRYFHLTELQKFASEAGMNISMTGAWMTESSPDENSWNAFMVLILQT